MFRTKLIKLTSAAACCALLLAVMLTAASCRQEEPADPTASGTTAAANTPTASVADPTQSTSGSTQPTEGTAPTEATAPTGGNTPGSNTTGGNTTPDPLPTLPPDQSSSVEIPPQKDPETGESLGISFPCQVPDYGLVIEKLAAYEGLFVEDGSNTPVTGVAMLMVRNEGDFPVEYTQISVEFEDATLLFDITALPVGQRLVVQEKNAAAMPEGTALSAKALVVQRAQMDLSADQISVTDNGDNTLTIRNLTQSTIPSVRVFYKHYMEQEELFVGGIAFTVRLTKLGAGAQITIQPAHYTSQTSRVVMVLTYDSE